MAKVITEGFVVIKRRMNPHRSDDDCSYTKFLAFLPDEESVMEYEKTHSITSYAGIIKLGEYWPPINLD